MKEDDTDVDDVASDDGDGGQEIPVDVVSPSGSEADSEQTQNEDGEEHSQNGDGEEHSTGSDLSDLTDDQLRALLEETDLAAELERTLADHFDDATDGSAGGADPAAEESEDSTDGQSGDSGAETDDSEDADERVAELERRLSSVADRLDDIDTQLNGTGDGGDSVTGRLDALEDELNDVARESDVRAVEENLSEFEARIDRRLQRLRIKALEDFANEIIQVKDLLDDMRRLMELESSVDQRLGMIEERIGQALESGGVERIDTDGTLDSGHRVEERRQTDEYDHEEIIEEVEIGYELDGKVIRPARVVVAEAPNEE
jgi:molecular chaperone GrpE